MRNSKNRCNFDVSGCFLSFVLKLKNKLSDVSPSCPTLFRGKRSYAPLTAICSGCLGNPGPRYKRHRRRRGLSLSSSTCSEFPRDFCLCCGHFPSHVCDKMCPSVYENPRAFGPSSSWDTDGAVHNNCLAIKRSSIDDLFLSFQHIFSHLLT